MITSRSRTIAGRLMFTLLALFAYRVGCAWPVPGVDQDAFSAAALHSDLPLLQALVFFGGSAGGVFSLFLLGTSPAIVAMLAEQLGTRLLPTLARIKDEPGGADRLHALARRLAAVIALGQAVGVVVTLRHNGLLVNQSPADAVICVTALTLGALLVMWLGEQITSRGLGQGLSVLIAAGLLAQTGHKLWAFSGYTTHSQVLAALILAASLLVVVYINHCRRVLVLHYPRPSLNELTPPPVARMPIPMNLGGVTPAIFAGALVGAPAMLAGLFGAGGAVLHQGSAAFALTQALLVVVFTFAYAQVTLDPVEYAERLRRDGAFIQGVRPGAATAVYLGRLTMRLSLPGGIFLGIVAAAPGLAALWVPAAALLPAGTGVIIIALTVAKARQQVRAGRAIGTPRTLMSPGEETH